MIGDCATRGMSPTFVLISGVWLATENATDKEWIQLDLLTTHLVESVTTQGRPGRFLQWVTSYNVSYSQSESVWVDIPTQYSRNVNDDTHVTEFLPGNTLARYVRLWPQDWQDTVAMRFKVTGCAVRRRLSSFFILFIFLLFLFYLFFFWPWIQSCDIVLIALPQNVFLLS